MPYTSQYNGPDLTQEEIDVRASLRRYSTAGASQFDWVPVAVLFRAYRNWCALHRWQNDPDAPQKLTVRQFGRAVRRVFKTIRPRKRTYHGNQQWGYAGLIGDDSIVTPAPIGGRKWPTNHKSNAVLLVS
jgi:hypothetical protein